MNVIPSTSADNVRQQFIQYFETQCGHTFYPSSKVVPYNDPTLLFINSGMSQFKPVFLGQVEESSPFASLKRVANSQKCIRAGGKHNDLDDVGKDVYHHTFFEMLGNWSFGDYFKKEAIDWAWDLLTREWKLPVDRLYVTYFNGDPSEPHIPPDDEARTLWRRYLPNERILPFGCKENFWEMGDVGPCGPCSEIHFDRIGGRDASSLVNQDDPDVLEIWNLVFMQYNRESGGVLSKLPFPCIDTGMGLERITSILQNKKSNYDTSLFTPIFEEIRRIMPGLPPYSGLTGAEDINGIDTAYRVVADHIRTLTVAMSDGCLPSNEGRGYVLRRILRRAIRFGHQFLNAPKDKPWFCLLVDTVVTNLGGVFPELLENPEDVKKVIRAEEMQFSATLDKGVRLFNQMASKLRDVTQRTQPTTRVQVFPGNVAFDLYATYGFPLDLTQLMAQEINMDVDTEEFHKAFEAHKKASEHEGFKLKAFLNMSPELLHTLETRFGATRDGDKYVLDCEDAQDLHITGTIKAIWDGAEMLCSAEACSTRMLGLLLDRTAFYAESGGQVADTGYLSCGGQSKAFTVVDVQKVGKHVFHLGYATHRLRLEDTLDVHVDVLRRLDIARNHTATHALNYALRRVLDPTSHQKGSLVEPCRARFDYKCDKMLTEEQVHAVEEVIQTLIREARPIYADQVPLEEARRIKGLQAVFDEAYPDIVRVVSVGVDIPSLLSGKGDNVLTSVELCGGTHLHNTCDMKDFVILQDESVSRGVRRLIVVTGSAAQESRQSALQLTTQLDLLKTKATMDELTCLKHDIVKKKDILPLLERKKLLDAVSALTQNLISQAKADEKRMKKNAEALGKTLTEQHADAPYVVYSCGNAFLNNYKALETVISSARRSAPTTPVLLLSHSATELIVLASTPDANTLHANTWVAATLAPVGGKAGGKQAVARGSVLASDAASRVSLLLNAAESHALHAFHT